MPPGAESRIRGLFTALITPFDRNGNVDTEALAGLVRFQTSKGTAGLYPCGTTGLGPMLSMEERKEVAETVIDTTAKKVPVVVQVGCADTASTVALAKHAEDAGADVVASLTPYYYKPGDAAVAKHFEAVSSAVDVPLFAYNIPQFTGNTLSPEAVSKLARGRVISGIKDSSRDILRLLDIIHAVPEGFVVMNGTEEYALFALMSGAAGLVSGAANALPELFASLVSSQMNGDKDGALSAQRKVLRAKGLVQASPIPAYYEILRARGIDCGTPRPPLLPLSGGERDRMLLGLREMGLLQP